MIRCKRDLKEYIQADTAPFMPKRHIVWLRSFLTRDFNFFRIRYIVHLRKLEYLTVVHPRWFLNRWYHKRAKNRIGQMFSWEVPSFTCESGLHLWHPNIVINEEARVGKNAVFHGNNCLGRRDDSDEGNVSPVVGDDFNLGFGAVVIGGVHLGNSITVGANSTVLHSCEGDELVLVGSPAHVVSK